MLTNLACSIGRAWDYTMVQRLHYRQTWSQGTEGWRDASEDTKWMIVQCATFFQESESSKCREKRFGYPYPYPVHVWKQFLDIHIRLQTHYLAGYPTGKPDSDNLWPLTIFLRARFHRAATSWLLILKKTLKFFELKRSIRWQ